MDFHRPLAPPAHGRHGCALLAGWRGAGALPHRAFAQQPLPPLIKLVVGYSAGGPVDGAARLLAPALSQELGTQVIVDNRPGASGSLGGDAVAKAAPDGAMLFFGASPTITINPNVQRKMAFDPMKDLTPIAPLVDYTNVLVINKDLPVRNVAELLAYAKARPGKVFYGSAGVGASNHLSGALLEKMTGVQLTHVPYKGSAPALADVMGGTVTMMFDIIATSRPFIQSGQGARAGRHLAPAQPHAARRADHDRIGRARLRRGRLVRPVRPGAHGPGAGRAHQRRRAEDAGARRHRAPAARTGLRRVVGRGRPARDQGAVRPQALGDGVQGHRGGIAMHRIHTCCEARAARTPDAVFLFELGGTTTYAALQAMADTATQDLLDAGVRPDRPRGAGGRELRRAHRAAHGVQPRRRVVVRRERAHVAGRDRRHRRAGRCALCCFTTAPPRRRACMRSAPPRNRPRCRRGMRSAVRAEARTEPGAALADTAAIIFTSGTSGTPKGVMVSHRGLLHFGRVSAAVRALTGATAPTPSCR
jgi:hypothetical protein